MYCKIIIIGSNGCLAKQLIETLNFKSYKLKKISRKNYNYVYKEKKLINTITKFKPKIIINCAALNSPDGCEKNPRKAYDLNAFLPYKLTLFHN